MKNKIILTVIIFIGFVTNIFPRQILRKAVFLHQSVGSHIYQHQGASTDVPTEITAYNTANNYTGDEAVSMDKPVNYPADGNMIWIWEDVFNGTNQNNNIYEEYINTPTYDIIIIKECFASQSDIWEYGTPSDTVNFPQTQTIYNYQWYCRKILKKMELHPNKFFVWWNIPPGIEGYDGGTTADASRLRWFNKWMVDTLAIGLDTLYGAFPANVHIFDYFEIVDSANFMPVSLADAPDDSHPNAACSELVAPLFVEKVFDTAIIYEGNFPLPVELSAFSAEIIGSSIQLSWRTETEVNNYGFEVERKIINWEIIGFVQGNGNSNSQKSYSFIDKDITNEKYFYRLKQIDNDGYFEYSEIVEIDYKPISTYSLEQNYPNPFNPNTLIKYSVAKDGFVNVSIFNLLGEKVATLVNGNVKAGSYDVNFNASSLSSGVYFYSIDTGDFKTVKKMMLMK